MVGTGGGIVTKEEIAQPIRGSHKNKIIIIYRKEEDDIARENRRDVPTVGNNESQVKTKDKGFKERHKLYETD